MNFISITEANDDEPRVSTLAIYRAPQSIKVVGILPHGYHFNPTTSQDRDNLVDYLQSLEYSNE